jgi:hypothetical protein
MLNSIQHFINDFSVFFGWIGDILHTLISTFLLPLNFVFTFVKAFLVNSFLTPIATGFNYIWDNSVMSIFQSLPYWNLIVAALIAGIGIIITFFILKVLTRI